MRGRQIDARIQIDEAEREREIDARNSICGANLALGVFETIQGVILLGVAVVPKNRLPIMCIIRFWALSSLRQRHFSWWLLSRLVLMALTLLCWS